MVGQTREHHRKLAKYIPPVIAFSLGFGAVMAHAGDAGYCQQYATTALSQFAEAKEAGCAGLKYPVWSMDFDHHYRWCLTVPVGQAQAGTALRSNVFANCGGVASRSEVSPIPIPGHQAPTVSPIPIPQPPTVSPIPIP